MRTCSSASDLRAALLLAALAIAMGCAKEAEIEDPPDLSALALVYDQPDGVVDPPTVTASFLEAVRIGELAAESGLGPFLRDAYQRMRDEASKVLERARERDRLNREDVDIDLSVELRRICNGWTDPSAPPNPDLNGGLTLHGVVRNDGTLPTAWGNTIGPCRETRTIAGVQTRLLLDGSVATYGSSIDLPLLASFSGAFGSATGTVSGNFDLRLMPNGQIEIRTPATTGGWVIFFVGAGEVGVRGANGRFVCVAATHVCTGPSGDSFQW